MNSNSTGKDSCSKRKAITGHSGSPSPPTRLSLKNLADQVYNYKKRKYPNLPEHALIKPKYSDRTTDGLIRCIIDFLYYNGYKPKRIGLMHNHPSERRKVFDISGRLRNKGSAQRSGSFKEKDKGHISAIIGRHQVFIRATVPTKGLNNHDQTSYTQMRADGKIYLEAHSFDQFYQEYLKIMKGAPRQ